MSPIEIAQHISKAEEKYGRQLYISRIIFEYCPNFEDEYMVIEDALYEGEPIDLDRYVRLTGVTSK